MKKLSMALRLSIVSSFAAVVVSALIFSKSYFNNSEIRALTEGCYKAGGTPQLEIHVPLQLDYSFSCKAAE